MTIRELRKNETVEKSLEEVEPAEVIGSQAESFIAWLFGSPQRATEMIAAAAASSPSDRRSEDVGDLQYHDRSDTGLIL